MHSIFDIAYLLIIVNNKYLLKDKLSRLNDRHLLKYKHGLMPF